MQTIHELYSKRFNLDHLHSTAQSIIIGRHEGIPRVASSQRWQDSMVILNESFLYPK
jgi:hypothetical protein